MKPASFVLRVPFVMSDDPLQTPIRFIPGVGPARAGLLEKLGIQTVEDLLWRLPRDVLDLTEIASIDHLKAGELQTVCGTVVDRDAKELSGGKTLTAVLLNCGNGYLRGIWFNQPWRLHEFRDDATVLFSGKPKWRAGRWEISHPRVQWTDEDEPDGHGGILPRYGLTEGLKMHEMRRLVRAAVDQYVSAVPEFLPEESRREFSLPHIREALSQVHRPQSMKQFSAGKRRLIFDDLFEFQLALALRRRVWRKFDRAPVLPTTAKIDARIRRLFPFEFTKGQTQAVREIAADLASGHAMHRLLQADVGAGKTAVALYAMLVAIAAGYQAVLMAPTELLALQHWATVDHALAQSRVERILLTGALTSTQRKKSLEMIKCGDVQLIVGTQAVIQRDVEFAKLGLVVIDEQHKFGVAQRSHFSTGAESPHILVMTATPIPRSLCLTQFGDLDITTITELPPGRQQVITSHVASPARRRRAWDFIRKQLHAGRQAYVVCPRIEASETTNELTGSAEELYRQLSADELADFSVGLAHGQMDRQQKSAAMEAFRLGTTKVLVSTTVVEVGVDVPNATLMVIQQAERFGLSQLHQLRGRIARGKHQGYCFLFSEGANDDAGKRLSALESCADGFRIAEVDFELRGPGDVLGTRQHGQLPLKVADLVRDQQVLIEARRAAFPLVDSGTFDEPHFGPLKIRVLERFGQLMDLPKSG